MTSSIRTAARVPLSSAPYPSNAWLADGAMRGRSTVLTASREQE